MSDDYGEPSLFCKRRNSHCDDDLCVDYGCALEAGMEPDRDPGYITIDELVPCIGPRRRK